MRCLFQFLFLGITLFPLFVEADQNETITLKKFVVTGTQPAPDFPINTPLNLNEFDRENINELRLNRVQDAAHYVPNFNLMDAGANGFADRSNVRGLANTPVYTSSSVVLYVDDVPYIPSFAYTNQLVGAESIEIYRGPQGGLFGKNSYGGVMIVKSRRPSNQWQGNLAVDKGNFDSLSVDSYLSGPIVKNELYFSMGGVFSERDGYLNNAYLNSKPDDQNHLSGRMSLLWVPNEHWEVGLNVSLLDFDDGGLRAVSLLSDDIYQTQSGEPGYLDQNADSQSVKITYHNEVFEVFSVTARRATDTAYSVDFDFLPQAIFSQQSHIEQQQWSQEFRFKSLKESDWRWAGGLFFSNSATSGDQVNTLLLTPEILQIRALDETAYAAFGQISYQGFDALRAFLDLRVDYVEKKIDRTLRSFTGEATLLKDHDSDIFIGPKLTLDYAFASQISAFISTGLAFKPGGFSGQSNTFPQYQKETMWASEIGIKSHWINDRIHAGLAVFYYDIENYQLEESFTAFDYTVINAPEVTSFGVELDVEANITDTLQITSNFGYTNIEFKEFFDPFTGADFQGNKVPYVPEFNFNIAGIYKHPSGFFARTDMLWSGNTFFDPDNSDTYMEADYVLLNAMLGYEHKHYSVNAYVNNLTDTEYFTNKVARANIGIPGEPRTFGARIGVKF